MKRGLIVLLLLPVVLAEPGINQVSGTFAHGGTATVTGSGFGSKNPAAPLIWDDGEDATIDNDNLLSSISAVRSDGSFGWDYVRPSAESGTTPEAQAARIRYRDAPFRNTGAPHQYSTKYISGCHYQYENNNPPYIGSGAEYFRDVSLTADSGAADKSKWFAIWYYRLDPMWPSPCMCLANHKSDVVQTGSMAYSGSAFAYTVSQMNGPCSSDGDQQVSVAHASAGCVYNSPGAGTGYYDSANPRLDWIHYEYRMQSDDATGIRDVIFNNQIAGEYLENCPNWFDNTRSFTAGGYYRRGSTDCSVDVSTFRGDENAFRYFDDVYIDTTFSRVMLANNQDYEQATITEPQIPQSWSDDSITFTVNLGKITGDAAYLFVFDSTNDNNPTGYEVDLGGSAQGVHISGVDDTSIEHGQSLVISGSGFGSKSPAEPVVWADFETGNHRRQDPVSRGVLHIWHMYNNFHDIPQPHLNSNYYIGGLNRNGSNKITTRAYNYPNESITGRYWYKSVKRRWSDNYWDNLPLPSGTNIKWDGRLYSEYSCMNVYPMIGSGYEAWDFDTTCGESQVLGLNHPSVGRWHTLEYAVDQGTLDGDDGSLESWNGANYHKTGNLNMHCSSCDYPISVFDTHTYITEVERLPDLAAQYLDDLYIDNSWARVMLGDDAEIASCTHREIQIPTAWSDDSVTVTANVGSISGEAYLFVINENGKASQGYPVQVSGSGCSPVHSADNDPCDGSVSFTELASYMDLWRGGGATIDALMQAIILWKG